MALAIAAAVVAWPHGANASSTGIVLASGDSGPAVLGLSGDDQPAPRFRLPLEDQADTILPAVPAAPRPKVQLDRDPQAMFLVCPVDAPRHYRDDFGEPRYFGGFHRHQGIDIFAPRGTPIRAPFDGRATSSGSWAGGLQVYLHGKRGFAFNAHLTRVGKLGKVKAGTVIGYVGNTGDARGSSTHDHFEWHPGGGRAVDSFRLLTAACSNRRATAAPVPEPPIEPRNIL